MNKKEPLKAAKNTSFLMNKQSVGVIFEATFIDGNFIARADIVRKAKAALEVFEVKSSLAKTRKLNDYIKDLTYTVMVIEDSGYEVAGAKLILISRDYRKGDKDSKLFEIVDVFDEVCKQKLDLHLKKTEAQSVICALSKPYEKLSYRCRNCEYLGICFGKRRKHSIFELPRFGSKKTELLKEGYLG